MISLNWCQLSCFDIAIQNCIFNEIGPSRSAFPCLFWSSNLLCLRGYRANYCFDKQSHSYTFLFAQTLRTIAPSNAFLFFTGSILIFKSFNSCMQATLNFATLHWIRNFWTHWLIDDAVGLMSVELFWCSHSKTVFSEIGPSRSVLPCTQKTHCVANVE